MVLHGGRAVVTGRRSDASLYDFNLATYDEGDVYDQSQAGGSSRIFGMTSKLAARRDQAFGTGVDLGSGISAALTRYVAASPVHSGREAFSMIGRPAHGRLAPGIPLPRFWHIGTKVPGTSVPDVGKLAHRPRQPNMSER
jgi:hypothetical protein